MEYRVEDLAQKAGVSVDTIRFYQGRGLLHPPRKRGRCAFYDETHFEEIERIKDLSSKGFSLALIKRVNDRDFKEPPQDSDSGQSSEVKLLTALVEESVGRRSLSMSELVSETGLPEAVIGIARSSGLMEPSIVDGEEHFSETDIQMLKSGFAILEAGFPLEELLALAREHAQSIRSTADKAINLFGKYVKDGGDEKTRSGDTATIFRQLLPEITRLVALHFQRTLVNRALVRMTAKQKDEFLTKTLTELDQARLEVKWR